MASIRPSDLPAAETVTSDTAIIIDPGSTVQKATPLQIMDAARSLASQNEAELGTDNVKVMSALRVKQAIDAQALSRAVIESPEGAALVGVEGGGTVQEKFDTLASPNGAEKVGVEDGGTVQNALNARVTNIATRSAMAGYGQLIDRLVYLTEQGREGTFKWVPDDLSAEVTADPLEGIYIAPANDTTGASGAWVRDTTNGLSVTATGAVDGDLAAGYETELLSAFKLAAEKGVPVVGSGSFRIDNPLILGSDYSGLTVAGALTISLYGSFTSNVAAVLIPQVGDNYGGNVAPANDVYIARLVLDGSNATSTGFTSGLVVFGGVRNRFGLVHAHDFLKSGILLASVTGERTEVYIDDIISHDNTNGTVGQGMAVESVNADDSITFGRAELYSNGTFGFDFSGGSVTFDTIDSYGNNTTAGTGGGGKFTGQNNQAIRGRVMRVRNNTAKGLLSNTGAFQFLSIDHFEAVSNTTDGLDIGFAGQVRFGFALVKENGSRGVVQSAASVQIGKFVADGNGSNGYSFTGGDLHIDQAETKNHPSQEGIVVTSTGALYIGSGNSVQDDQGFIRIVPTASNTKIAIGNVSVSYTGTPTTGPCVGVFLSANATRAKIGKVTATGTATALANSGTSTNPLTAGNSVAATTLGAVAKKVEIFDATGTSLGFVPVYDAIT